MRPELGDLGLEAGVRGNMDVGGEHRLDSSDCHCRCKSKGDKKKYTRKDEEGIERGC
jgi:hypothetical protein